MSAIKIEQSLPDAVGAFIDWLVNESGWKVRRRRRAGPGARHLHPLPPLPQLRRGRHAALRPRARGARRAPRARRRQDLPRSRGGRNAPRRALRDRVAGRRAVGVRDAARRAVRDRRRGAARVEAAVRRSSIRSEFRATPMRRPPDARSPRADRRQRCACCSSCIGGATTARSPRRSRSCSTRRARMSGSCCAAPASRRWPTCCTSRELAREYEAGGGLSFRGFVDELRDAAETAQAGGGADPRRGQRRRAPDDGAQGERARVPDRDSRRPHVQAVARGGRALARSRRTNLCALKIGGWAPIDLLLHDAEEAARDRAEARAADLRRRHPRARPARRSRRSATARTTAAGSIR